MKYAVFFLLCSVALAAAAPQPQLIYPGIVNPWNLGVTGLGVYPGLVPRTVVAGPTVVNTVAGRYITPGVVGTGLVAPGVVGPVVV